MLSLSRWRARALCAVTLPTPYTICSTRCLRGSIGEAGRPGIVLAHDQRRPELDRELHLAIANRKVAREDGDPLADKRSVQRTPTFEAAAKVLEQKRPGWRSSKHGKQW